MTRCTPEVTRGLFVYLSGCCLDDSLVVYDGRAYEWVREALEATPYFEERGLEFWAKYDDGAADLLRGLLVSNDLLEYGTSPRGAWLSDTGRAALMVLQSLPEDFDYFNDERSWHRPGGQCDNCDALTSFKAFVREVDAAFYAARAVVDGGAP
ncbi:MAG: hypothetical protein P1V36_00330 [Planctomycetota bacterium]|nr:hypothetical protein [Planctomycetota bacterium]